MEYDNKRLNWMRWFLLILALGTALLFATSIYLEEVFDTLPTDFDIDNPEGDR